MALQVAFDWAGSHTYDFKIKDPNADPEAEPDIMTYINRRMMQDRAQFDGGPVPDMGPRQNFLRIVEEDPRGPMGFMSGKGIDAMHNGSRVHSQTPEVVGSKIKLSKVFENKEYKGAGIEYEYDFGDCWEHEITVVGRADPTSKFVCIDGEGHGAAEDAGSVRGWNELVEAYRTANPNKDQREKRKWFETQASNSDPRGLGNGRDAFWDKAAINAALSH
jgi:hypothetical protein